MLPSYFQCPGCSPGQLQSCGSSINLISTLKMIHSLALGRVSPDLSDEVVITREICGEYCKFNTDKDLFTTFAPTPSMFSPQLTDRTLCIRLAANRWHFHHRLIRKVQAPTVEFVVTLQWGGCCWTAMGS